MKFPRQLSASICAATLVLSGAFASYHALAAEKFPERPVEIIVNFGPGGSADQAARSIARFLPPVLGVAVPISNVTGASGTAGLTRVRDSRPDGYTMGTFTGIAVTTMIQGINRQKLDDFIFLAIADAGASMFYAGKGSRFKTFKDVLDEAKKNPGKIRVATAGFGTQDDVAVRALTAAGYPMVNVPMDPGPRHMAPLGGHAELVFQQIDGVANLVQSGDLAPLVIFANERHPSFPNVPTAAEFGFKLNLPNWRSLVVVTGTPVERVAVLTQALEKVLASKEYREVCERQYKCLPKVISGDEAKRYAQQYYSEMDTLMTSLDMAKK